MEQFETWTGGKFAFSIYDFDGNETMDAFYLGDCLRALNLNPTNATVDKMGGTKLKSRFLTFLYSCFFFFLYMNKVAFLLSTSIQALLEYTISDRHIHSF
jgi:hypothetical protein